MIHGSCFIEFLVIQKLFKELVHWNIFYLSFIAVTVGSSKHLQWEGQRSLSRHPIGFAVRQSSNDAARRGHCVWGSGNIAYQTLSSLSLSVKFIITLFIRQNSYHFIYSSWSLFSAALMWAHLKDWQRLKTSWSETVTLQWCFSHRAFFVKFDQTLMNYIFQENTQRLNDLFSQHFLIINFWLLTLTYVDVGHVMAAQS